MAGTSLLEAVRAVNTGILLWEDVGPLIERALANGDKGIDLNDIAVKSEGLSEAISDLDTEIAEAEAEGYDKPEE